jgi:hypothetical protein
VPGVDPYEHRTVVTLEPTPTGTDVEMRPRTAARPGLGPNGFSPSRQRTRQLDRLITGKE